MLSWRSQDHTKVVTTCNPQWLRLYEFMSACCRFINNVVNSRTELWTQNCAMRTLAHYVFVPPFMGMRHIPVGHIIALLYVYACMCMLVCVCATSLHLWLFRSDFLKATMFFDLSLLKLDKAHWHSENLQKAQTVKHTLTGFGAGEVLATKSSRLEIRPGLSFKIIWGVASTCSLQRRILTGVDIVFINTYTCMYTYIYMWIECKKYIYVYV